MYIVRYVVYRRIAMLELASFYTFQNTIFWLSSFAYIYVARHVCTYLAHIILTIAIGTLLHCAFQNDTDRAKESIYWSWRRRRVRERESGTNSPVHCSYKLFQAMHWHTINSLWTDVDHSKDGDNYLRLPRKTWVDYRTYVFLNISLRCAARGY